MKPSVRGLCAAGIPVEAASLIGQATGTGVKDGLVALGTTIADGAPITAGVTKITTSSASTGVNLPAVAFDPEAPALFLIKNASGQTINIWPHSSTGTINGGGAGSAQTIANGKHCIIARISSTDWMYILLD